MSATKADAAATEPRAVRATVALLEEVGAPLKLAEVELGPPAEGEILVRIVGAGICHTDISAAEGKIPLPLPTVLGHEGRCLRR
jgi:aryl-alcohol dehydrogenase